jgi:hypothetical protein
MSSRRLTAAAGLVRRAVRATLAALALVLAYVLSAVFLAAVALVYLQPTEGLALVGYGVVLGSAALVWLVDDAPGELAAYRRQRRERARPDA